MIFRKRKIRSNRVSWAGFTSLGKKSQTNEQFSAGSIRFRVEIHEYEFRSDDKSCMERLLFALLRSNGFKGKKREKRKKKKREKKKTKKKKEEEETIDIWMDNGKYNFFTSAPTQNGITTKLLLDFYFYIRLWTFNKAVFTRSGVKIRDEEEERRLTFFHMDVCCSIF